MTCRFALCELDLKPPLVSRNTISQFASKKQGIADHLKPLLICVAQFQKRRQLRQRKKHKENQLKRKADKGSTIFNLKTTQFNLSSASNTGQSPPPDLRKHMQQISPENFHNLLSLASSPPLPSHIAAGGSSTHLNPTALEFIPGKEHHVMPPVTVITEQSSTPSFAQVCTLRCSS